MSSQKPPHLSSHGNIRHYLHDLAQPLATVTGLVDLLLLEMDEQDQKFSEIRLISEQLEKVLLIVGELRQIVREAAEEPPAVPAKDR